MVITVLDLFSGAGSVNQYTDTLPGAYDVVSIDITDGILGHHPTHISDVRLWDYKQYAPDYFDLIWASPPCEQYSVARTTGKLPRNLELADALSSKALDIIKYFTSTGKKVAYAIENPRMSMLWKRQHMLALPEAYLTDYCKYSDWGYQKPTKICCNFPLELKLCRRDSRCEHIMTPEEYLARIEKYPWLARKSKPFPNAGIAHRRCIGRCDSHSYSVVARVPTALIKAIFEQLLPKLLSE